MARWLALPTLLALAPAAAAQPRSSPGPEKVPRIIASIGPAAGRCYHAGGFGRSTGGFAIGPRAGWFACDRSADDWSDSYAMPARTNGWFARSPSYWSRPAPAYYAPDPVCAPTCASPAPTRLVRTSPQVTLTLPAAGLAWLNGVEQPDFAKDHTLTIDDPAGAATFVIRARWWVNGQAFEYDRTLTLMPGEQQGLAVFRGTPVK
jgi:hypothetical protein